MAKLKSIFKIVFIAFAFVFLGYSAYILWLRTKSTPVPSSSPNVSVFSSYITTPMKITGTIKNSENVKSDIRPACPGEYYLYDGSQDIWLTSKDSTQEDRQTEYGQYEGQEVEVDGEYLINDQCDIEGQRMCTCFNLIMVREINAVVQSTPSAP